jgi:WD40 repeat protein
MAEKDNKSRKTRIFISYSRKDKLFVRKLNDAIDAAGIDAWVDWEGIPLSSDWMAEIGAAIQAGDAFIFVISPHSLKSKPCMDELELGIKNNKKIIPVLYREPEKTQQLHPKLSSTNWVYMRSRKDDFKSTVPKLVETIQTDLGWVQQHTRILQRASEWNQKNRNKSYLLQGSDLEDGERWMTESTASEARAVVPLQAEYISTSRKVAIQRQRYLTIGIGFILAISVILGFFAIRQWFEADANAVLARNSAATAVASKNIAATQQAIAEQNAQLALQKENEAKAQRSAAQATIYEERPSELDTSTLLALDSWTRAQSNDAENILRHNIGLMPLPVAHMKQDGRIWNLSPSADGKYFVTASDDHTACLWTMDGVQKYCVKHNGVINDALLTTDNALLVTAGADGFVNLWNGENGSPIKSFDYKVNIWDIDISANNKWLAAARADGSMSLINLETKKEELSFNLNSGEIFTVAFSPNSELLALGTNKGKVTIWRVMTGISYAAAKHDAEVYALDFSADGNWLVSGGQDSTARVSKVSTGTTKHILSHNDWVEDVAFGPDSSWFVTVSDDNLARVWDTESGREKFRMNHAGFVLRVDVSPNGQWIVTTGFDKTARIWESASGTLMREIGLDAAGSAVSFSPDNTRVIVGDYNGNISVWDVSSLGARDGYIEFPEFVHKAKFSYTGEWVIFNSDDKKIWLVPTDQLTKIHDVRQGTELLSFENITAQTVSETYGRRAVLYNIETKARHILPHKADISGIGFNGDGKLLATTSEGGTSVYIWDVESGQLLEEIPFDETAFTISFNPIDGSLAIGFANRIVIWDIAAKKEITSLAQFGDIKSLTFSKNGHWLATTSSAGGISVWDMSNGQPTQPTYKFLQDGSITSLDFDRTQNFLASGGSNGYAYLWDLTRGQEVARLPHNNSVTGVSFSPTTDQLLTVSQKTVKIWDLAKLEIIKTENISETACSRLSQNFSTSTWAFFFHEESYHLLCPNLPQGK